MCHPMTQIRRRVKTYLFITICIHRNKEFCQLQIEFHATYYCLHLLCHLSCQSLKKTFLLCYICCAIYPVKVLHLLCHLSCQSVTSAVPYILSKCYICCAIYPTCQSVTSAVPSIMSKCYIGCAIYHVKVLHRLCHLSCQSVTSAVAIYHVKV